MPYSFNVPPSTTGVVGVVVMGDVADVVLQLQADRNMQLINTNDRKITAIFFIFTLNIPLNSI